MQPQRNTNGIPISQMDRQLRRDAAYTSSTRTRLCGSCLRELYYKTFFICRTCMRCAPARPVRACIVRKWRAVSNVTLKTRHFTLHPPHFTLHSSHSPHSDPSHFISSHLISSELFSPCLSSSLLTSSLPLRHPSFAQLCSSHRSSS